MSERKLPDPSYSAMCRNAMSELCIEGCLLHGDGRNFELDPRMTLDRAPNRDINHLKPKLQFEIVKAKQTLIINHLLGKGDIYVDPQTSCRGKKGYGVSVYSPMFQGRPLPDSERNNGDNRNG